MKSFALKLLIAGQVDGIVKVLCDSLDVDHPGSNTGKIHDA